MLKLKKGMDNLKLVIMGIVYIYFLILILLLYIILILILILDF